MCCVTSERACAVRETTLARLGVNAEGQAQRHGEEIGVVVSKARGANDCNKADVG
jgi:hypothetical protein